ncbi:MAG TPA: VOC family protein [Acidimicrobiales bacterium]|nr:VOC family protein [Acidimicrobiales bacterium]
MTTRDPIPTGAPCWVDLTTSDTQRSRDFYCQVFGWTADEPVEEFGGYFNFSKDGVLIAGGMAKQPDSDTPDAWSVYLTTDDAAKALELAAESGGTVYVEAMQVDDLGTMAFVGDAGGAGVGVWQPGQHQGFGLSGQPGTPSWFELHTRDYEAAVSFYRDVFHWETKVVADSPEFRYTTLVDGETMLAGIMDASGFLPEGVPAHWSVYFGVADADATLDKIVELGGAVVTPAEDTPYGRLAVATDPTGAQFKLVAPNAAMPAKGASD